MDDNVIEGAFPTERQQPVADGTYLSIDQLRQLDEEMTMGDTWRATDDGRAAYPDDPDRAKRQAGMLAFLYVARRIGTVAKSTELGEFLDLVRQDDFLAVMQPESREAKSEAS